MYTTPIRRGLLLSEGPISPTVGPSPAKTLEAVERLAHSHKVTVEQRRPQQKSVASPCVVRAPVRPTESESEIEGKRMLLLSELNVLLPPIYKAGRRLHRDSRPSKFDRLADVVL